MSQDNTPVSVNERVVIKWRLEERPDKSIPVCAQCKPRWLDEAGKPAAPGEGYTLRCTVCGLDCT